MAKRSENKKPKMPRDWHAVNAQFRKAGSMGDDKKEQARKECRTWKHKRGDG